MRICLAQHFVLGRFHATPWKVFPYDDPFGEWPPSPWRLLRGLLARSHQIERETATVDDALRQRLVDAVASSRVEWQLPTFCWRGPRLRQYQPADFQLNPAQYNQKQVTAERGYKTTKVQDNFWLTGGDAQPLYWFLEGHGWQDESVLSLLDQCLARMTYFGRAESITVIERVNADGAPEPNCYVVDVRKSESVPILCPRTDATLDQLQLTTDDPVVRNSTVPPGAVWRFVERPQRPGVRPRPQPKERSQLPVRLLQFALGTKVALKLDHLALIANWFRGRTIRSFLKDEFGVERGDWIKATEKEREAVALLAGKDSAKKTLKNHQHAYFGFYLDPDTGKPTRLLAWRSEPFSPAETRAIRNAASEPFSLAYRQRSEGERPLKRTPWKVHCVPLDNAVPPPPGFDPEMKYRIWISLTPYVPPRHVFGRRGKPKAGESPIEQLTNELELAGLPPAKIHLLDPDIGSPWLKVHRSATCAGGPTNLSKRSYRLQIEFVEAVAGPIAFGHSCHFGLGLFRPLPDSAS